MACSGWSLISAAGCSASGFSSAQPRPKPGAAASAIDLEDAARRGAGRVEAIPAVAVGLALAEQGERVDLARWRATQGVRGRAIRSTTAPVTGLPSGSSTRPATVIRAVATGSGFVVGEAEPTPCGATFATGAAGSLTGSSFIASERASQPGAGGDGGQERARMIAVSLSLWKSMVRRTSWARAAAGRRGPAGGGVTGREGDRGPGGGIAQEGRNGRRGRPGRQDRAERGRGQARCRGGPGRSGACPAPGQPAAERAGRAAEATRRLVEGEALEVAEHHRQPEGSGRRSTSPWRASACSRSIAGRSAGGAVGSGGTNEPAPGPLIASPSSRRRRRPICCLAHRAVRIATPYSQLPSRSGSRIDRAFRARTRNTAWKVSSACCTSPRSCRQTPSTIGPCRPTSAAKAASPAGSVPPPMYRSRSWRSESPAVEPPSKSAPSCRTTEPDATCVMPDRFLVRRPSWHGLPAREEKPTGRMPVPRRRRPLIPTQGTVAPPAELSRHCRRMSSVTPERQLGMRGSRGGTETFRSADRIRSVVGGGSARRPGTDRRGPVGGRSPLLHEDPVRSDTGPRPERCAMHAKGALDQGVVSRRSG